MKKTNDNPEEKNKDHQDTKPRIYAATQKDWDDFFAAQEDPDALFDR